MSQDDQLPIDGLSGNEPAEPIDTAPASETSTSEDDEAVQVGGGGAVEREALPIDTQVEPRGETSVSVADAPSEETAPARPTAQASPTALYFLTNRMNLNGVLSSRIVAPRESHAKYYVDLLEKAPGWVPLLTQPPTTALIEAVTTERGAGAPVLIEFPLDIVEQGSFPGPVAYVPAVAFSQAVAVHFREERDLREHRARSYNNVHPHDHLLKVSPDLFLGEVDTDFTLAAPPVRHQVDWRRIDRVRGAINAAITSAKTGEQLAAVAAFLGETRFPATVSHPNWLNWQELDDHDAGTARVEPDLEVPDHVGFRSAYEVLGEQDVTDAWSPNQVLDAVATRVDSAGLAHERAEAIIQNLQRVRSIVNVEADFEPFRPTARALVSAKALLLVLLRPELEELLAWPDAETGADDLTIVTAAVLAGRLRGLARESISLRSLALDDLTAAWAVGLARVGRGTLGKVQYSANSRGTALKVDGVELATRPALLPDPVAKYWKLADAKKEPTRIKISRAMGWPVTHRLDVPEGSTVTNEDAAITIATPGEVTMVVSVQEAEFVSRLGGLTVGSRRRALDAFDLRRR